MDIYDSFNKFNQTMEYLSIARILFIIVGLIGLLLIIYGFYKNSMQEKRRGIYIFLFGTVIAGCLYLIEHKAKDKNNDFLNNTYYYNE